MRVTRPTGGLGAPCAPTSQRCSLRRALRLGSRPLQQQQRQQRTCPGCEPICRAYPPSGSFGYPVQACQSPPEGSQGCPDSADRCLADSTDPLQQPPVSYQSAQWALYTASIDEDFSPDGEELPSAADMVPPGSQAVAWDMHTPAEELDETEEWTFLPSSLPPGMARSITDPELWTEAGHLRLESCAKAPAQPGPAQLQAEPATNINCLQQVFVLLFGVGASSVEGVHTIRVPNPAQEVNDVVVAFEAQHDASRYATQLEASMRHAPVVSAIQVPELLEFCQDAGHQVRLEGRGTLLQPPPQVLSITDWERSLRLRNGTGFSVLDAEPELPVLPAPSQPAVLPADPATAAAAPSTFGSKHAAQEYTDAALADIRQRLEELLGSA